MKKHIEKIKKRPIEERKKMATILAVAVTIIIIILWIILLSVFKDDAKKEAKSNFNLESFENAFQKIGQDIEGISETFETSRDDLNALQDELETLEAQESNNSQDTPDDLVNSELLKEFETEINNTELENTIN